MANVLEYFTGGYYSGPGDPWYDLAEDLDGTLSQIAHDDKCKDKHWIRVRQRWFRRYYDKMIEQIKHIPYDSKGLAGALVEIREAYFELQCLGSDYEPGDPESWCPITTEEEARDALHGHLLWPELWDKAEFEKQEAELTEV